MAAAGHSACWLTWKAEYDPKGLTQADVARYDTEMHELLPRIMGGAAALATLCPDAAKSVQSAVQMIAAMDAQIGAACVRFREGDIVELAGCHEVALARHDTAAEVCGGLGAYLFAQERLDNPKPGPR